MRPLAANLWHVPQRITSAEKELPGRDACLASWAAARIVALTRIVEPTMSMWEIHRVRAPGSLLTLVFAMLAGGVQAFAASEIPTKVGASGLALPRFVSLKSDRVNLRNGPGTEYPTSWVFQRAGLPVEVISEFESWRQIRDAEGTTGWVLQSLLSGRRTALVAPWDAKSGAARPQIAVHAGESDGSRTVVMVEAGVIANVASCNGRWCEVSIDAYRGYIEQKRLWGVYESEVVK